MTEAVKARAIALLLVGVLAGARLLEAQAVRPEGSRNLSSLELLQTAHTLFVQGDYEEARKYYLQVLPSFPQSFDLLKNLAYCYFQARPPGLAQAAQYYARAYAINPGSREVKENLAKCYMGLRRYSEAGALLRKMAALPDAPPDAWKKVAEAYDLARRIPEAEAAYDAYLQRHPGDLEARSSLGRLYSWQKAYGKAMAQFRIVLASNPNFAPALIGMARVISWQGQHQESLQLYERVLRVDPRNSEAIAGKAFVLLWMGRIEESRALFAQLHKRYPHDVEITRGFESARAAFEGKIVGQARRRTDTTQAEADYRKLLAEDPQNLTALKALAELTATPQRCLESIEVSRRALEVSPGDATLELPLARALAVCQQYAEAIARYRRFVQVQPKNEDALFDLGNTMVRARRFDEAAEVFRSLLQVNPRHSDGLMGLARALAATGNHTEALLRYDQVLETSPDNYDALQGKAYILFWTNQFAQARLIFLTLAEKRPSDPQNAEALENIARAEEEARWAALRPPPDAPPQALLRYYEKRLASYPDDKSALKAISYLQTQLQNLPAAIRGYRQVLEKYPDDRDAKMELARLLSVNAQYDESLKLYREVLKSTPDDADALENLARVYLWSGHDREALETYRGLLAKNPSQTGYKTEVARLEIRMKDYPAAREILASLVSADPHNREARLQLAQLDLAQNRWDDSLLQFRALLDQNPRDPDALLGKAQISYYQGHIREAQTAASIVVEDHPDNFSGLFLLANIEHARDHRRAARELLDRADRLSPHNSDVLDLKKRISEESRITVHTSASFAREIGPATEFTSLAGFTRKGLANEDVRFQAYGTTIGFSMLPRVDSHLGFTSLPTQSPTPSIGGAVAPWSFIFRNSWHLSKFLTIRGGTGLARFGPPELDRSPFLDDNLTAVKSNFGVNALSGLGINPTHVTTFEYSPTGSAGLTISPSRKFSIDLDWTRSPAVYLPTPFAMKFRLTETRFTGGLNFFFTPRTDLHFEFFYTRLYTGSAVVGYGMPDGPLLAFLPLSKPCKDPTPVEVSVSTNSHECLGGQVSKDNSVHRDWGHGGATTFNQNIVHREHFSLDGGYRGVAYGYAGQRINVRPRVFLGFFNPVFYQNHSLTGRIYGKLFGPVSYDFSGAIGIQQTDTQPTRQTFVQGPLTRSSTVTPSFSFRVNPHLSLGIAYTHYNTAQVLGPLRGNVFRLTTDWPAVAVPGVAVAQAQRRPQVVQGLPKFEIFAGPSLLCSGCQDRGRELLGGWQASVGTNLRRNFGITADFGGQYRSLSGIGVSQYEYLFGPHFARRSNRTTAFVHALFGGVTHRGGGIGFGMGFGGGLDVNVSKRLAIRAVQFDYVPNHFTAFGTSGWDHDLRLGVGVVIKAGGQALGQAGPPASQAQGRPQVAQGQPKFEIFAGPSLLCSGCQDTGRELLGGGQASVAMNLRRNFGITADFGGQYRRLSGIGFWQYEYLIGPHFARRSHRTTAFVHALFGGVTHHASGITTTGLGMGIGGGLDVNVGKRLALRAVQFDYMPNHFKLFGIGGWDHDLRLGVGVVIKIGSRT